jgi:uncharacterized protein YeaO (DUF488 family)
MGVRVVRLGTPRKPNEGLRLGTVRRPPRGVAKTDFSRLNYYDVWLPELAPGAATVSWAMKQPWTDARWRQFTRRYRREMRAPSAQHLIAALAALSHQTNFAIGCYCADADRCHRSVLRDLLEEQNAAVVDDSSG